MTLQELNKIKKARRDYQREWRRKNPEKVKATQERYWLRRAQELTRDTEGGEKDVQTKT